MLKKIAIGFVSTLVFAMIAACNVDGGVSIPMYSCDCNGSKAGHIPFGNYTVPCAQEGANLTNYYNGTVTCTPTGNQNNQPPGSCTSGESCCGQPGSWNCTSGFPCINISDNTCLCGNASTCN